MTVPAEKGDARNLTNTAAVMERDPAWSPDGKTIAYFSDESGEYALHLRQPERHGRSEEDHAWDKAFYFRAALVARQQEDRIPGQPLRISGTWTSSRKPVMVDKDYYAVGNGLRPAWSPDSKWLAYSKHARRAT